MVHLIPHSNNSEFPCRAVEEYSASRPDPTSSYIEFQIAVGVLGAFFYLALLPTLYLLRDEPRFYKVRPFYMFAFYGVGTSLYAILTMLPEAGVVYPCWFFVFIHVFGSVCIMSLMFARSFVLVTETQYQVLLGGSNAGMMDSDESTVLGTEAYGLFRALSDAFLLGFMFMGKNELSPSRLFNLKHYQLSVILMVSSLPFLAFCIAVGVIPILHLGCSNCMMFTEFVIVIMVTPTIMVIMVLRFIYLALQLPDDEQGVVQELRLINMICSPILYLAFFLFYLADPNNIYYNREFNPQVILVLITNNFMWIFFELLQVIRALQFKWKRKGMTAVRKTQGSGIDFRGVISQNEDVKKEFYKFAARRFVLESLNFLDDTEKFEKGFNSGKSEKWIRSKAAALVNTYIKENSPQEVNISSAVRNKLLLQKVDEIPQSALVAFFGPAIEEIVWMVFSGPWLDFQNSLKHSGNVVGEKMLVNHPSSIL